jgi:hypothetical protein
MNLQKKKHQNRDAGDLDIIGFVWKRGGQIVF